MFLSRLEIEAGTITCRVAQNDKETAVIDAELPPQNITPALFQVVDRFEPYGAGNLPLVFVSCGLLAAEVSLIGKRTPRHIRFTLDTGDFKWKAVLWNGAGKAGVDGIKTGDTVDILYSFKRNWFRGVENFEIIIADIRRTET